MGGMRGRSLIVRRGGVQLQGLRTKGFSVNGSPIDVTNDDDDGVRKVLDQPGQLEVELTVAGIVTQDTLRNEMLSTSDRVSQTQFVFGGFEGSPTNTKVLTGDFFLSSYRETGEYQGAITFEATFVSAGAVTYTA